MGRLGLMLVACACVVACGSSASTAAPTVVASPAVDCGDFASSLCRSAAAATLRALGPTAGVPVRVELSGGVLCASPSLLFTMHSCPLPFSSANIPATGSATVSFAHTTARGYLNLFDDPAGMRAELIAIATPPPTSPPATP